MSSPGGRGQGYSGALFCRAPVTLTWVPSSKSNELPAKAPPPIAVPSKIKFQHANLGEHTPSVYSKHLPVCSVFSIWPVLPFPSVSAFFWAVFFMISSYLYNWLFFPFFFVVLLELTVYIFDLLQFIFEKHIFMYSTRT